VKRNILRKLAHAHGARIFVETGTLYGETLSALRDSFDKLYSIELSKELYQRALRRFAGDAKIRLLQGDSGDMLADLVKQVDRPALFWLDGHYSGGPTALGREVTPVLRELEQIALVPSRKDHLVVVDDARLFDGTGGYPTIKEFENQAKRLGFAQVNSERDMILLKAIE
jgi:hypothetical protein